ncbi:UDP-N-acetylmuramyl pentapeptide phosphotransferase/UDP-N-acetylglucosamine-1-phosphate transferase [Gulbenkiania indica]|uniref:UDP-N-acetylmuramyl pentapeptide phosphotransferase/UDP-N-acetylglucosamine-1-phosphate transferase n=1 Tax=Gulbenkiania indica TaxID=375574 RepID=A0A0K6H755_9NEIS|nr:glycosyltransferase family 4 protein [Gulbenkiania indica]CUA86655.1 UDP-N-acetylmuramyl pentapeptide phosphotransferase/UDP-N-acetylglucosamine-1-phosphate transferase [Gulbenkiania indica]
MNLLVALLLLLATTILLAWVVAAWVLRRAEALRLVQIPNHRSSHAHPTPNGGGLGIVVAASMAGLGLVMLFGWVAGGLVLGLAAMLAAVGLRDDIAHLPARVRFGVQVMVCAGVLVALGELPPLTLSNGLKFQMGEWILFGLLLLAGVWWINLFNFMDGIDGIAGMQAVFMLVTAGVLAVWVVPEAVHSPVWMWMLCVAAATAGFLLLNWPPARIFMGDVGSTWLAFMVFALALLAVQAGWLSYAVWLVLAAVFVTDATVTLLTRMLCGERWYEAHRSHAYQRLSRRWQSDRKAGHRSVTLLVAAVNGLWLAPWAWACLRWPAGSVMFVMAAYLPLVLAALWLGAGRPDHCLTHDLGVRS